MKTFNEAWQAIKDIRGWFSNREQARVMWEAAQKGGHVIEIGSYCGRSAVFLAYAIQACASGAVVHCVDTFGSTSVELDGQDTLQEFLTNIKAHDLGQYIVVHQGRSDDKSIIQAVPTEASLVYIDACHDYDCVKSDIANWRRHVAKGGTLVLHDYYTDGSEQFPGVKQAADEAYLVRALSNRNIIHGDSVAFSRPNCTCGGW